MAPAQALFMAVISAAMVLNYMLSTTTSGNRSSAAGSSAGSSSSAAGSSAAAAPEAKVIDARFSWPPSVGLKEQTTYAHLDFNTFTLHGVWPKTVTDYRNPSSIAPARLKRRDRLTAQVFVDMVNRDPNFYDWAKTWERRWTGAKPVPNPNGYLFWRNQWLDHGIYWGRTRSESDVYDYLRKAGEVHERFVPRLQGIAEHFGHAGRLKNEYVEWISNRLLDGKKIYIRCWEDRLQKPYLHEISICVDYDTMTSHVDCPDNEYWDDINAYRGHRCPDDTPIFLPAW